MFWRRLRNAIYIFRNLFFCVCVCFFFCFFFFFFYVFFFFFFFFFSCFKSGFTKPVKRNCSCETVTVGTFICSIRNKKKKKKKIRKVHRMKHILAVQYPSMPACIVLLLDILFVNRPKVSKRSSFADVHVTNTDLYEIQLNGIIVKSEVV